MRGSHVIILSLMLCAIGLSIFTYKYTQLEFPLTSDKTDNSWYVEVQLEMTSIRTRWSKDYPAIIKMLYPIGSEYYSVVNEHMVNNGFGGGTPRSTNEGNREATFTKRNIDKVEPLFFRAIVYKLDAPRPIAEEKTVPVANSPYDPKNRPQLAEGETQSPIFLAIDSLIDEARTKSADQESFVGELYRLAYRTDDDRIAIVRETLDMETSSPEIASALIEAAGVPVRMAHGVKLVDNARNTGFYTWLEAYTDGHWNAMDPETGRYGISDRYLTWWRGDMPLYALEGQKSSKSKMKATVSVRKNTVSSLSRAIWKTGQLADTLLKFSLFNLPIDTQLVFQILIMIPLGALVISFLRQVIGIKTFGTFMPILIALAFRETGLLQGVVMFIVVVGIGLLVRTFFDKMQLLMVPRLTAVLTVVVIMLCFIALITHNLGINAGISVALFPIVVLTMTIERMSIVWEETGPKSAFHMVVNSLVCAIIGYLAMNEPQIQHMMFTFPELLLVVLAGALMLGRYNGYKVTEYARFRFLKNAIEEQYKLPTPPKVL